MRQRVINSFGSRVATQDCAGLIGVHGVRKRLIEWLIEIYANVKSLTGESHLPVIPVNASSHSVSFYRFHTQTRKRSPPNFLALEAALSKHNCLPRAAWSNRKLSLSSRLFHGNTSERIKVKNSGPLSTRRGLCQSYFAINYRSTPRFREPLNYSAAAVLRVSPRNAELYCRRLVIEPSKCTDDSSPVTFSRSIIHPQCSSKITFKGTKLSTETENCYVNRGSSFSTVSIFSGFALEILSKYLRWTFHQWSLNSIAHILE